MRNHFRLFRLRKRLKKNLFDNFDIASLFIRFYKCL
jgi:hypothetical protein